MSGAGAAGLSALLGAGLALGTIAASAVVSNAARALGSTFTAAVLGGSALRVFAALAGVTIGVLLGPPSPAAFVAVYLIVYLVGTGALLFGLGRGRRPGVS
jgi:hypothetical protein